MNLPPQPPASRRRIWPWVLGLFLAPFVILGAMAVSFLTLDRAAAVLRKQVMAASHADWRTKVQLSVGRVALGAVGTGLSFVHSPDIADAQLALKAVRQASVGVYQRTTTDGESWSREQLFSDTDKAMGRRCWSRLVGVVDDKDVVLVYVPAKSPADGPIDICVSVLNDHELVVVSASVDADGLAALVEKHGGEELTRSLKLAKF